MINLMRNTSVDPAVEWNVMVAEHPNRYTACLWIRTQHASRGVAVVYINSHTHVRTQFSNQLVLAFLEDFNPLGRSTSG
jgi:hypothetical protein